MPQPCQERTHGDGVVVVGPPDRRVRWPSWLSPIFAAAAVAAIVVGIAAVRPPGPGHRHQVALPTSYSTPSPSPTPPARRHHLLSPVPTVMAGSPTTATPLALRPHMPAVSNPSTRSGTSPTGTPIPSPVRTPGPSRSRTPGPSPSVTPDPSPSASEGTLAEEGYNKNGIPTFSDYQNASSPGPTIAFGQVVQVSCKVYDASIPSASPGWLLVPDR